MKSALVALAESVGLATKIIVAAPHAFYAISPNDIGRFKGGYQFRLYWRILCRAIFDYKIMLMHKSIPLARE